MLRYILNRILWGIVAMIGVSIIIFVATRATGDVVELILGSGYTPEDAITLRAQLGLDKPIYEQYVIFFGNVIRGKWGYSYRWNEPSMDLVLDRMPATLELTGAAMFFALAMALPVGVYSARKPGGTIDSLARGFAVLGQAMPAFWVGLLLMWFFAVQLRLLPTGGWGTPKQLILPAITLGWFSVASLMRLTRSAMLDVLNSEYIVAARAKGVPEGIVVWKHALKNALMPVVTMFGLEVARLLGGTVIIETIFSWPGVGRLLVDSIFARDYTVVQAGAFMISFFCVAINLLVDISYGLINPRVHYFGSKL
jgi:peptide/nickel transport system permease protein